MRILWTKTGSDGNCTVIETADGGLFMIDCGIKLDIVNQKIGYRLNEINYCLVTHNHNDHVKYISKVLGRGIEGLLPIEFNPRNIPQSKFCIKNINPRSTIKFWEGSEFRQAIPLNSHAQQRRTMRDLRLFNQRNFNRRNTIVGNRHAVHTAEVSTLRHLCA